MWAAYPALVLVGGVASHFMQRWWGVDPHWLIGHSVVVAPVVSATIGFAVFQAVAGPGASGIVYLVSCVGVSACVWGVAVGVTEWQKQHIMWTVVDALPTPVRQLLRGRRQEGGGGGGGGDGDGDDEGDT